jgi:hypothetical protein
MTLTWVHVQKYVCWDNQFLCPVVAGEPLSHCAGACYSKFMYTCTNNILTLLPPQDTPFTLTVDNPNILIHGKPVTASGLHWLLNGETSSYCPTVVPRETCPPGNITVMVASGGSVAMSVMVPGGQQAYLDPYWNMKYTQAHSAYIPQGGWLHQSQRQWLGMGCLPTEGVRRRRDGVEFGCKEREHSRPAEGLPRG